MSLAGAFYFTNRIGEHRDESVIIKGCDEGFGEKQIYLSHAASRRSLLCSLLLCSDVRTADRLQGLLAWYRYSAQRLGWPETLSGFLRKLLFRARPSIREVAYLHGFLTVLENLVSVVSKVERNRDEDGD